MTIWSLVPGGGAFAWSSIPARVGRTEATSEMQGLRCTSSGADPADAPSMNPGCDCSPVYTELSADISSIAPPLTSPPLTSEPSPVPPASPPRPKSTAFMTTPNNSPTRRSKHSRRADTSTSFPSRHSSGPASDSQGFKTSHPNKLME